MDRFVDYGAAKRGMSSALQSVIGSGGDPYSQSRAEIGAALTPLRDAGAIRRDIDAEDVLRAMGGGLGDALRAGLGGAGADVAGAGDGRIAVRGVRGRS